MLLKLNLILEKYTKNNSSSSRSVNKKYQDETVSEFINSNHLHTIFTEEEYFIIQTYILSRYKLVGNHEISHGIDYDKLCDELKIPSKTYAKKLVHTLQRNTSKLSCQFIFTLIDAFSSSKHLSQLIKSLYFFDDIGRHVIPCYETTKILLSHMRKTHIFVEILITQVSDKTEKTISFSLEPANNGDYQLIPSTKAHSRPIMIFKGIVRYENNIIEPIQNYIARFLKVGFNNTILANMAQHPQYAGKLLTDKKINPYPDIRTKENTIDPPFLDQAEKDFLAHKHLASLAGCSQENSSLFLLTHVRCNNLNSEVAWESKVNSYAQFLMEETIS